MLCNVIGFRSFLVYINTDLVRLSGKVGHANCEGNLQTVCKL